MAKQLFKQRSFLGPRLVLLVLLSLVLMTLDQRQNSFNRLHAALSATVAPIQYLIDWPVDQIRWVMDRVSTHQLLVEENAQLRAHQIFLQARVQRLLALEKENSHLRALLRSSTQVSGPVLAAQILAVNLDPFVHQVVLNVGKKKGVYVGQPVLDAYGVMGQVIMVGPLTSRVLLLADSRSAIPVQVNRNGVRAIAVGSGISGGLALQHVADTADVRVGDVLVSSGLGQRYPVGYPVGQITKIDRDPGQPFATVEITPKAHLTRSREVLLVWPARLEGKKVVKSKGSLGGGST